MNMNKKSVRMGLIFLVLIIVSGLLLMYTGNDAIAMGIKKKDGILTAEQVKVSFKFDNNAANATCLCHLFLYTQRHHEGVCQGRIRLLCRFSE